MTYISSTSQYFILDFVGFLYLLVFYPAQDACNRNVRRPKSHIGIQQDYRPNNLLSRQCEGEPYISGDWASSSSGSIQAFPCSLRCQYTINQFSSQAFCLYILMLQCDALSLASQRSPFEMKENGDMGTHGVWIILKCKSTAQAAQVGQPSMLVARSVNLSLFRSISSPSIGCTPTCWQAVTNSMKPVSIRLVCHFLAQLFSAQ